MKHFTLQPAKNLPIEVPSIAEQRRIGAFFDRLDSLITLHQRKYDKLCVLKKSMLDKMFPTGGSLYPEIRFAGFTDPWEQRKLSDLTDRVSIQSSDSDLPQVEYEDIIPGEGTLNKDLRDKKGGKTGIKFYAGDVLYGKLRPYLMNWLYPQFNGVAVGDFWVLRATECDSSFLYRLVQTGSFQRLANVSSGSKMPRADWNLISQSFFAVPADHAEQKAIAKGLAELDTLITLHQRKYDKLCVLKKSMLDKMFPKGGSLYPEIRFAGFTDPWEQRKLGELFEESDERASDREILSVSVANGIYPASESDRETNPGASLANYKVVHSGDVVYNSMRMWQGAVDASRYDGIVSPAYVVAKPNSEVYARFFARLLRQPMLLKQYQQVSQGNSKDTQVLKFDDFASIEISMPASENEQRQIGAFFDRLDSLITLHQRKLELLRNIKKSMLDKMFV